MIDGPTILVYLRTHPDSTCADIAHAFAVKPAHVSPYLRELKAGQKIVHSKGKTRGTRYRVAPGTRVARG